MSRTKTPTTEITKDPISSEAGNVLTASQNALSTIVSAAGNEHDTAAKLIHMRTGRKQMGMLIQKLVTVTDLVDLQNIKESKSYKNFLHKNDNGTLVMLTSWAEYCEAIEGRSHITIDLDLKNLKELGPELFESMRNIGLGPSTMRSIRQLPEDKQALIQQAIDTTDKDDLAELIDSLVTKHIKEKETRDAKIQEQADSIEAKDSVAETNRRRIDELQEKAALLKKLPADEKAKVLCSEIAAQQTGIDQEIRTNFYNALQKLVDHGDGDHQAFINAQIQMLTDAVELLRNEFGGTGMAWENA